MAKKKKKQGKIRNEPYDPEKADGSVRPVYARIAAKEASDKYSEYPSNGLTPVRLAQIFRESDDGDVRRQMELFEEMEEKDPHLFSQLQTRKQAVTGLDWEVQPVSPDPKDKQIAQWVQDQMKGMENLNGILLDLLDAIGKGISVMEILWDVDGQNQMVISDILQVHPKKLMWDAITDEMRICTEAHPEGISLPHNKFVVHRYKAKSGHDSRAGILRVVSWMYLFKNYSLKDWVAFCEVYGMPLRLGKYDASASEADKRALMEAIVSLGSDAAGIAPSSTSIEFIEAENKNGATDTYEKLARYCDEQISKAILGQTLTSDSGGGSYAQSKTHDEVRHDLTVADAKALSMTIRRDIIGPLVEYNFGPEADLPLFEIACEDPEDLMQTAEIYVKVRNELGVPIAMDHIYKKFGIPKPESGEAVIPGQSSDMPQPGESGLVGMKTPDPEQETEVQDQIDQIVELSVQNAGEVFRQMTAPIRKLVDECDDMQALKAKLEDADTVRRIYEEMDLEAFTDYLHQGIYFAELIGRSEG